MNLTRARTHTVIRKGIVITSSQKELNEELSGAFHTFAANLLSAQM